MILPTSCPNCKATLEGADIKPEERAYVNSENQRWSRVQIVVEGSSAKAFKCPDCQHEWPIPWLPKGS